MEKLTGIYKIINPNGKIYIGKSVDILKRIRQHKCYNKNRIDLLAESFMKYEFESHKFYFIFECDADKLNNYELYFIKKYDSLNKGLNSTTPNIKDNFEIEIIKELNIEISLSEISRKKSSKGRKLVPNSVRLNLTVPASDVKKVKSFVKELQKEAINKKSVKI